MRATKGDKIKFILIALLLLMGVGYAYLTTNLNINGTANINRATWDVHFENVNVRDGSVTTVTQAPTINSDLISINYVITLNEPGDFYEFTVDVKNSGTIDAMIETITSTINGVSPGELPAYLIYSATYSDGEEIEENHMLNAGDKETYKIRLEYNTDVDPSDLPQTNQVYNISFSPTITQKNNMAQPVSHALQVGDYFSLTPDSNSYTILTSDSGYNSNQTINPSELQLWMVISINEDDSVDAISEYVSSTNVNFKAVIGYANCVNTLKTIAQQYYVEGYTKGVRMFGFDNQTLIIEDTYYFDGRTASAPRIFETPSPTSGLGEEYDGGLLGDTLYLKDYILVSNAYKSKPNYDLSYGSTGLLANSVDSITPKAYCLSSRQYFGPNVQSTNYKMRYINASGYLYVGNLRVYDKTEREWNSYSTSCGIRPIITLKSNIKTSGGQGTKEKPYVLTN